MIKFMSLFKGQKEEYVYLSMSRCLKTIFKEQTIGTRIPKTLDIYQCHERLSKYMSDTFLHWFIFSMHIHYT